MRWTVSRLAAAVGLFALSGCASGNLHTADRGKLHAPAVKHPYFEPYAPYGSAPAVWRPVVTSSMPLGRPRDPVIEAGQPDYEHAPWSVESKAAEGGTF
ncbi:MAG: hypothetical protein ABF479_10585 [Gluconacetobacter sp.]